MSGGTNNLQMNFQPVTANQVPRKGDKYDPRTCPVTFDFSTGATFSGDLSVPAEDTALQMVQAVYIDNLDNASTVTLTVKGTGQRITAQPGTQGTYPVIGISPFYYEIASTGGVSVNVLFLNYPTPFAVWGPETLAGGGAAFPVNPNFTGNLTDHSAPIANGGTSVQLIAANAARKSLFLLNPANATNNANNESAYIKFGAAAGVADGASWELTPGGIWEFKAGFIPAQSVNFNAATAGHVLICYEG